MSCTILYKGRVVKITASLKTLATTKKLMINDRVVATEFYR